MNLEQLLNRRGDISTFLVHLTRRAQGETALDNLCRIVDQRALVAKRCYGVLDDAHLPEGAHPQAVVCFSETPLEHVWTLCEQIEGRAVRLEPYGIVLTKGCGRRQGANPVWYTDVSWTGADWLVNSLTTLVDEAKLHPSGHSSHAVFKLTPYIDRMGRLPGGTRKEFWWEREWRVSGDFRFDLADVVAVLAPQADHARVSAQLDTSAGSSSNRRPPLLDPRWSPDRMLAALSGVRRDVGPVPDYP